VALILNTWPTLPGQGKHADAEGLYRRALAIREKRLAPITQTASTSTTWPT